MPIRIRPVCKHCGQAIHQDDYFSPWIHENARVTRATNGDYRVMVGERLMSNHGRRRAEAQARADRINGLPADHEAMPRIDVVKRGET